MNDDSSEAKLHALDYWQIIRNRYGVILLAFFLVFMTACVVIYIIPAKYLGKVQMEIARDENKLQLGLQDLGAWGTKDMNFIQTQFKVISSQKTLNSVIEQLGLKQRWGLSGADALDELRDSLETDEVRGTNLIDILIFRQDPDEAAEIANAIAESYRSGRSEKSKKLADQALATLDQELNEQQDRVEKARVKMLNLMEKFHIVDLRPGMSPLEAFTSGETYTGQTDIVGKGKLDVYEMEQQIQTIRTQINALTDKDDDDLLREAWALKLQDQTIQAMFPQYLELQRIETGLRTSGYGSRHPTVLRAAAETEKVREILITGVKSLKNSLHTQLEIAEKTRERLQDLTSGEEDKAMAERRQNIDYSEAKKDYQQQKMLLATMYQTFLAERVDKAQPKTPIEIHERAVRANSPAKPNVPFILGIGAVVGLGFGIGLAFFLEYLDTSVKSLEDVERYLEVPVLAVIPKDVGVLHKQSGISPDAEAYRILRTNIEFNRKSADANAITVVSGGAGEGKSTTLVNLAYVCAQGGYNTLMIDGDLRRPKLHTFFDINNSVGLTNYLTTELVLEDVILQTPIDNLYFMPSGILPADAAGILNSRRMSELIADVKSRFDLVLIDSPPILGVSDASVLASEVDLTMIVIQHRKLPRSMLLRVKQAIENVGGNLLGVVLNNVDVRSDSQYQYYTSYYTYYSPTNTPPASIDPVPSSSGPSSTKAKGVKAGGETGADEY